MGRSWLGGGDGGKGAAVAESAVRGAIKSIRTVHRPAQAAKELIYMAIRSRAECVRHCTDPRNRAGGCDCKDRSGGVDRSGHRRQPECDREALLLAVYVQRKRS